MGYFTSAPHKLKANLGHLGIKFKYIYVHHTWKKVGILATGCRRYWATNDAKRQKKPT